MIKRDFTGNETAGKVCKMGKEALKISLAVGTEKELALFWKWREWRREDRGINKSDLDAASSLKHKTSQAHEVQ